MIELVRVAWAALGAYLAAGGLFCVAFQLRGLPVVDPAARGCGLGFRLLISPGVMALWPWLAVRWLWAIRGGAQGPALDPIRAHGRLRMTHALAWKGLAILVPIALGVALWSRPAEHPLPSSKLPAPQPGLRPAVTAPR
jgi:hypothetical protein